VAVGHDTMMTLCYIPARREVPLRRVRVPLLLRRVREEEVRVVLLRPLLFRAGTLAPFLRASSSPIAIACFRLVTFV